VVAVKKSSREKATGFQEMGTLRCAGCGEEFVIGRTPQSMDQRIAENKQGGSKKSWRKSTSAKGSTPTESNCRTESDLDIRRQRRLIG
jgi:uncharacterized Zn finger protein (UPF0148 family)